MYGYVPVKNGGKQTHSPFKHFSLSLHCESDEQVSLRGTQTPPQGSPVAPKGHEQANDPGLFWQMASLPQGLFRPSVHSSTSAQLPSGLLLQPGGQAQQLTPPVILTHWACSEQSESEPHPASWHLSPISCRCSGRFGHYLARLFFASFGGKGLNRLGPRAALSDKTSICFLHFVQ